MAFKYRIIVPFSLCLITAVLFAQDHTPEREKNPFSGYPAAIAAGQRLYEQACQTCHGGERAPALSGQLRRGNLDGEIFLNIRNGIAGTQMPPFSRLTTEQLWQLVSYIRSLSATTTVTPKETSMGNLAEMAAGESLFFGKGACATCHEVNGRGAAVGPDLSAAGRNTAEALRQKILDPGTSAPPNARRSRGARGGFLIVRTKDGRKSAGSVGMKTRIHYY